MVNETLQEQLASTKRTHILDAAARVFAERGFHATTIRDVAKAAGVADGTIYNYFENKPALLLGLIDPMTRATQPTLDPANLTGLSLREAVRVTLSAPLEVFGADNFELFRVIVSEIMVNAELRALFQTRVLTPMLSLAEDALEHWAQANGRPSSQMKFTVRMLSSLTFGLILQRIMGDELLAERWDEFPDLLADLLVNGLGDGT